MLEDILFGIEILLLVWIVVQGEIIVRCERGVYRLYKEREDERRKWREEKRQSQRRKSEPASDDSPFKKSPTEESSEDAEST